MSCLLHGSLAVAAILFVQRIQLAPQAEPFKWNVAMVAPSPMAAIEDSEASVPAAQANIAPAPALLQQPTPPAPTARPVTEPLQPKVETPAIPPPPPVAPVVEKPALVPIAPVAPPPIAEITPKPPAPSKSESVHQAAREHTSLPAPFAKNDQAMEQPDPVASPTPPVVTSSPNTQTAPTVQSIDTPMDSPPRDPTPTPATASSPTVEPSPQHTSTAFAEPTPPAHSESPTTQSETQATHQPTAAPGPQVTALAPAGRPKLAKADYGWLSDLMARWIEDLDKRYPAMLRTEGVQGKVTLTAMLHEDGLLSDVRVAKSSGNAMLDQVAVEDVRNGPTIKLSRPLERPRMPVKFSIIYDLKTAR